MQQLKGRDGSARVVAERRDPRAGNIWPVLPCPASLIFSAIFVSYLVARGKNYDSARAESPNCRLFKVVSPPRIFRPQKDPRSIPQPPPSNDVPRRIAPAKP